MSSSESAARPHELSRLSRVHVAQLAAYAASRLRLPRPDLLRPRDRAQLAAAQAALDEIDAVLARQRSRGEALRKP